MNQRKEIPVLLLTGYLGSGKTTLLNRILSNGEGIRFAVIVNDIGEVNIDAELIERGGIVGQDNSGDLVALQNGCICCTLQTDLINQLMELVNAGRFDYIVIEASGICEPEPIARTIAAIPSMASPTQPIPHLDCIVTVVDTLRMKDEFECGSALERPDIDDEDLERLVIEQIEFCNIVLLNKVSMVTPAEADGVCAVVRELQPKAEIIRTDWCDVPLKSLLNTGLFNYDKVATSARWIDEIENHRPDEAEEEEAHARHHHHHHHDHDHEDEHEHGHEDGHGHHHHHHHHHHDEGEAEEYGIGTMVYYRRRPFDLNKFDYLVGKGWPDGIIRSKGVVYFSQNRDMSYLFEQAGNQTDLREAGYWFATASEEDLAKIRAANPDWERDWDPEYGDRMIKLVLIGRHLDRDKVTETLDACLE